MIKMVAFVCNDNGGDGMLRIFQYLTRKERYGCAVVLLLIWSQVWLDLKLPDYMATITILVETPGSELAAVFAAGTGMLGCAFGSMLAFLGAAYLAARIATGFARTLRGAVYDKTLSFSLAEMNRFSTASLINRTTNDITQVQQLVTVGLQAILKAPFLAIWAIVKIADKEWQWSAATAVAVFLIIMVLSVVVLFVVPRFRRVQRLSDTLNRILREQLMGIRVIRAYHAEQYEQSRFAAANHALWQNNITAARIMALMFPMMMMVHVGLTLAIYWIGAYIIAAAGIPDRLHIFSDMVVFSNYAMQVITAFMLLNLVFILVPRAQVSIRRLLEVLMVKPGIVDGTAPVREQSEHGTVEFSQVSFAYPGAAAPVLQDVSFRVKRGRTLAIIGATGSGKTSLVQLINRTYDVLGGTVFVDGQDVRDYAQVDLHRLIGYVPQQSVLMTGTIAENIAYGDSGRPAPDRQAIERAARIACCTEFIAKLPAGYDSPVAQGGINFSGGQRQRLAIARAIAWQPEIFIFDDSFSALDYATDRQIRQQLDDELSDAVKIIVAQRIGTIRQADEILVLDHGQIAGRGTHDALMHSCTVYQEIARSQLSEEELTYG